jgi:hypothetical protein
LAEGSRWSLIDAFGVLFDEIRAELDEVLDISAEAGIGQGYCIAAAFENGERDDCGIAGMHAEGVFE